MKMPCNASSYVDKNYTCFVSSETGIGMGCCSTKLGGATKIEQDNKNDSYSVAQLKNKTFAASAKTHERKQN